MKAEPFVDSVVFDFYPSVSRFDFGDLTLGPIIEKHYSGAVTDFTIPEPAFRDFVEIVGIFEGLVFSSGTRIGVPFETFYLLSGFGSFSFEIGLLLFFVSSLSVLRFLRPNPVGLEAVPSVPTLN